MQPKLGDLVVFGGILGYIVSSYAKKHMGSTYEETYYRVCWLGKAENDITTENGVMIDLMKRRLEEYLEWNTV